MKTVLALVFTLWAAGLAASQDADGRAGALLAKLPNDDQRLQDVAFSPDGRLLAAGYGFYDEGGVTVWDVASRRRVATLLGGSWSEAGIERVAFSPDGKLLAAASDRGHLLLWTVGAWRSHKTLLSGRGDSKDLVFSPDGTKLAYATETEALLYDLRTGRPTVFAKQTERARSFEGVSFTPDGRFVVACAGRSIVVWDVAAQKILKSMEGPGETFFGRLSPDGTRLVVGGGSVYGSKNVEVRTFPEGEKLHGLTEFRNGLFAVAVSNSGKLFALAGGTYGDGGDLSVWDMSDAREIGFASYGRFPIQGVAFSPDERLLAAASEDGFVLLYDLARLRGPHVKKQEPLCAEVASEGGKTFVQHLAKVARWFGREFDFPWRLEVSNAERMAAAVGAPVVLQDWSIESSAAEDRARVAGFRTLLAGGRADEAAAEHIVFGMSQNPDGAKGYVAKIYADGSFVSASSSGKCLAHGHLGELKTDFEAVRKRLLGRGLLAVPKEPLTLGAAHYRTHFIEVFSGGVAETRSDADDPGPLLDGVSKKREAFRRVFEPELPFINSLLGAKNQQAPANVAGPSRRKELSP